MLKRAIAAGVLVLTALLLVPGVASAVEYMTHD
jgi:ABC-type transport system involved in cytochrome c biogenesis permease subunit